MRIFLCFQVNYVFIMTRRKSVYLKWTLVLFVVVVCQLVHSRPQEAPTSIISSSTNSVQTDIATENPIRYRFRHSNLDLVLNNSPIVIDSVNAKNSTSGSNLFKASINATRDPKLFHTFLSSKNKLSNLSSRQSRLIKRIYSNTNDIIKKIPPNRKNDQKPTHDKIITVSNRRPIIKKVITKWTDKTKYEDITMSYETQTSVENDDSMAFTTSGSIEEDSSTEFIIDKATEAKKPPISYYPNKFFNKLDTNKYYDAPQSSEETVIVHSNNVHIMEYPFPSARPSYIYTTPTPTPIITNVGNPNPWPQKLQTVYSRPTTRKPVRVKPLQNQYNYHNSAHNYPQSYVDNFEVTTFQPSYTERIVIRPEEYSAPSQDCPTIYLTLNNTFQGQGKEACPDLNIAVNTNVVNKNVVVESEEDDAESLFSGGFGLTSDNSANESGDDDSGDSTTLADYFDSAENENEVESASIEATEFSNLNANNANADIQAESGELAGFGSKPSSALSHKPGRPGNNNDDDVFTISGVLSYFKPALNAMNWLAAINPLSFGIVSFLLTPLAIIIALYSGVAALLAPLGINLAREAPKVVHVYRPHWEWDHHHKTWQLNSFPNNRRWKPRLPRYNQENKDSDDSNSIKPTLFFKIKQFMKEITNKLKDQEKKRSSNQNRRSKRRKRDVWTSTIK